jgi:hypothetical protein
MSKYKKSGKPKHSGQIIKALQQALAALFKKFLYFVERRYRCGRARARDRDSRSRNNTARTASRKGKYIVLKHIAERHDAVRRNDRGGIRDRLCEAVRASFKLNFNCAVALCR